LIFSSARSSEQKAARFSYRQEPAVEIAGNEVLANFEDAL